MDNLKIFDQTFHQIIHDNLKTIANGDVCLADENNAEINEFKPNSSAFCSVCHLEFDGDNKLQRDHYKLDWHRYNLKQTIRNRLPITEEEFNEKNNDLSSISGSDSENETINRNSVKSTQGRLLLETMDGRILSVFTCLIRDKKEEINDQLIGERLRFVCCDNPKWAVLMLGGGHFAGAIFNGLQPILHKTFHCYTVRAGQGGGQSQRDGRSATAQPRSAGASLRRYNEQSLIQHVKSILELWSKDFDGCSLIMYRAAGPYNRAVLFGGNPPILDKNDKRLRTIPFTTRRPTFGEVKRVHTLLIGAQLYESEKIAREKLGIPPVEMKSRRHRSKSREIPQRPDPIGELPTSSSEEDVDIVLNEENVQINLDHLKIFDDTLTRDEKKIRKKPKRKSKAQKAKEKELERKNNLIKILINGDLNQLQTDLTNQNEVLDLHGNTPLHLAASNGHIDIIGWLLEQEADVCVKNQKNQTPYLSTNNKEIREIFKQFARENPNKFNYNKAQIPINALTDCELNEKRRELKKMKKTKEKLKKQQEQTRKQEELEKERFLKLSDREKRALAAERRILSQSNTTVLSRCFQCANDITGKVPFEYGANRFCTIACLQSHRIGH